MLLFSYGKDVEITHYHVTSFSSQMFNVTRPLVPVGVGWSHRELFWGKALHVAAGAGILCWVHSDFLQSFEP